MAGKRKTDAVARKEGQTAQARDADLGACEPTPRAARLLDVDAAARYLATSRDTVQRLINSGALAVVRLPVQRTKYGIDPRGSSRRVRLTFAILTR